MMWNLELYAGKFVFGIDSKFSVVLAVDEAYAVHVYWVNVNTCISLKQWFHVKIKLF